MFLWQGTFHEFPFQLINCIDVWSGLNTAFAFFSFPRHFQVTVSWVVVKGIVMIGRFHPSQPEQVHFPSCSHSYSWKTLCTKHITGRFSLLPVRGVFLYILIISSKCNRWKKSTNSVQPQSLALKEVSWSKVLRTTELQDLQSFQVRFPDVSFHHMQWFHQWHHLMHIDACPHQPHTKGRNPNNYPTQSSFARQKSWRLCWWWFGVSRQGTPKSWTLLEVEHQYPKHQDWPTLFEQTWFYNWFLGKLRVVTGLEIMVKARVFWWVASYPEKTRLAGYKIPGVPTSYIHILPIHWGMNKCYQSHPCSPTKNHRKIGTKFQLLNRLPKILMLSCLVILVVSFTKNVDEIILATTPSTKKVMLPVTRPWAKKPRESPIEGLRRVVPKKIRRRFFMDPATLILSRVAMRTAEDIVPMMSFVAKARLGGVWKYIWI